MTGLPGSGKTSVAEPLAARLGAALIAKDHVKEVLADALGEETPRGVGVAAVRVIYALAARAPLAVLESFFWPGTAEPDLLALGQPLVQVHCDCPPDVARQRFLARIERGDRHPVHHAFDDWERWSESRGLLDLPGPTVRVDTTCEVDVDALAETVRAALAR